MNESIILTFDHVSIAYGTKRVVENLSFTLHQGEVLAIVGESGSGKTSVLKSILGILGPQGTVTEGDIRFNGQSLVHGNTKDRARLLGSEMACIFQDTENALCPICTIGDQCYEMVKSHQNLSRKQVKERTLAWMAKVGLSDPFRVWDSYPFELSGGMNQRVGIVMALLLQPSLLLADEPTSALDVLAAKDVLMEMKKVKKEQGQSLIWVTHQMEVAEEMADRVLVMQKGKVVEQGPMTTVLEAPKESHTKKLLDAVLGLE